MEIAIVKNLMNERLTTANLMNDAARKIGVSLATMYRYKSNPELIPLGKLISLCEHLGFPLGGSITWSKNKVLQGERRRYELEKEIAEQEFGKRYVITPSYTVTSELPEVTRQLWDYDYGTRYQELISDYIGLRQERCKLYQEGKYESFEIINGFCYKDFFYGQGRFKGLPKELRMKQIDSLIKSLEYPHVNRRIYLKATPELPIFSCFSTDKAVIRIDDFIVEFNNETIVKELVETYNTYYDTADIINKDQVKVFLQKPD
jgi:hypothetical protein